MSNKKLLAADDSEIDKIPSVTSGLVRVEESIEKWVAMKLPSVPGTKLQVCPLYTTKEGQAYFRCNYWKHHTHDTMIVTRTLATSRYIKVEGTGPNKVMVDLTK